MTLKFTENIFHEYKGKVTEMISLNFDEDIRLQRIVNESELLSLRHVHN